MFATNDVLTEADPDDIRGGVSIMLAKNKVSMIFMSVKREDFLNVLTYFGIDDPNFETAKIQHTPVRMDIRNFGVRASRLVPVFCAAAGIPETVKASLAKRMTKTQLKKLLHSDCTEYQVENVSRSEELRSRIQSLVRQNLCEDDNTMTGLLQSDYQPIIALSYDKKQGCQVHLVRAKGAPTKATLAVRWDNESSELNASVSFALFPKEVDVLVKASKIALGDI